MVRRYSSKLAAVAIVGTLVLGGFARVWPVSGDAVSDGVVLEHVVIRVLEQVAHQEGVSGQTLANAVMEMSARELQRRRQGEGEPVRDVPNNVAQAEERDVREERLVGNRIDERAIERGHSS